MSNAELEDIIGRDLFIMTETSKTNFDARFNPSSRKRQIYDETIHFHASTWLWFFLKSLIYRESVSSRKTNNAISE